MIQRVQLKSRTCGQSNPILTLYSYMFFIFFVSFYLYIIYFILLYYLLSLLLIQELKRRSLPLFTNLYRLRCSSRSAVSAEREEEEERESNSNP